VILALLACLSPAEQALELHDLQGFEEQVQPVLAARCANPSCHGDAERPLELYALHFHRMEASMLHRDAPLDERELRANALRLLGVGVGVEPARSPALRKPLAVDAGGQEHVGGDLFGDTGAVDYRALRSWLEDEDDTGGAP
jgi:hypothetical protein